MPRTTHSRTRRSSRARSGGVRRRTTGPLRAVCRAPPARQDGGRDPPLPAARRARPTAQRVPPGAHPRHRRDGGRGRVDGPRRGRGHGRRRRHAPRDRPDGRTPHGGDAAPAQPGRRLRLPGLRLARPGRRSPARRGVLRERRQGGRRGGDPPAAGPGVLRDPLGGGPRRAHRVLAGQAGPAHRADGAAPGRHPLHADLVGRRPRHHRRAPAPPRRPRPGDLLHVGQDLQRGRVRLPALRAGLRHQQPPRLLQHVPRVVGLRARRHHRHRQGLGQPRGHPPGQAARRRRAEPGHQPPADALRPRDGQAERREDHLGQPARGGRAGPLQEPADAPRASPSAPRWPTCTCPSASTATWPSSRRSARCSSSGTRSTATSSTSTSPASRRTPRTSPTSTGPRWRPRPASPGSRSPRRPGCSRDSPATITCWAMGITQHHNSVATIKEIVNVALLQGNIGKPGAGLCPVRGHSNVQGDRTMGIWERVPDHFLDAIRDEFGFDPPREHGHDTVDSIRALRDGKARVFFAMGGNFVGRRPRHRGHRGRDAQRRAHGARLHQAQPLARRPRRRGADPPGPGSQREGHDRRPRPAGHRRGLHVGRARLARSARPAVGAPALRGRHRLLDGAGHPRRGLAGPVGGLPVRLHRDPPPDRPRRARLRVVRREGRPARRLRAAAPAPRQPRLRDREPARRS